MVAAIRDDSPAIVPLEEAGNQTGIAVAVSRAITEMNGFLVLTTLIAAYFGAALATVILRRYDSRILRKNDQLEFVVERRSQALIEARDTIIFGLAKLAEWRDDCTGGHLDRIRVYDD